MYHGTLPEFSETPCHLTNVSTLKQNYHWPQIADYVPSAIQYCVHCAKDRVCVRKRANPLELFPAFKPPGLAPIVILGPYQKFETASSTSS